MAQILGFITPFVIAFVVLLSIAPWMWGKKMKSKLATIIYTNGKEERFAYLTVEVDDIKVTFILPDGDIWYIIIRNCNRIDMEGW